jgi:hypothetical protein
LPPPSRAGDEAKPGLARPQRFDLLPSQRPNETQSGGGGLRSLGLDILLSSIRLNFTIDNRWRKPDSNCRFRASDRGLSPHPFLETCSRFTKQADPVHHAEIAAPTAKAPKEIGVLGRACDQQLAFSR